MGASGGGDKCVRSLGSIQNCPGEAITQWAATSILAMCWELPSPVQAPRDSKEVRRALAAVWKVSALRGC